MGCVSAKQSYGGDVSIVGAPPGWGSRQSGASAGSSAKQKALGFRFDDVDIVTAVNKPYIKKNRRFGNDSPLSADSVEFEEEEDDHDESTRSSDEEEEDEYESEPEIDPIAYKKSRSYDSSQKRPRNSNGELPRLNSDGPIGKSWDRIQAVLAKKNSERLSQASSRSGSTISSASRGGRVFLDNRQY